MRALIPWTARARRMAQRAFIGGCGGCHQSKSPHRHDEKSEARCHQDAARSRSHCKPAVAGLAVHGRRILARGLPSLRRHTAQRVLIAMFSGAGQAALSSAGALVRITRPFTALPPLPLAVPAFLLRRTACLTAPSTAHRARNRQHHPATPPRAYKNPLPHWCVDNSASRPG